MLIDEEIKLDIKNALDKLGVSFELKDIIVEHSKDKTHGDYASNIAMKLARVLKDNPLNIANKINDLIDKNKFEKIEVKAPGFINFFIKSNSISKIIKEIIDQGDNYGRLEKKNKKVNVEFVSANPTGNLHVGHCRCAAYGDSLARILDFAGYDITREYYVNDAGNQINNLAESIYQRIQEIKGLPCNIPADGYMGEDVKIISKKIYEKYGDKLLTHNDEIIALLRQEGINFMLENIKKDLNDFNVRFDVFSSETDIRKSGAIERALDELKEYIYVNEGATFLKTSAFIDDKDRTIIKSNGDYTYFLPDIAYHYNKMSRGFDLLIDVLGADHHGYINRMKSALMMKGYSKDSLEIPLIQVVRLMDGDTEVKMSKRTGNAISLKELCEEVGVDAARYFFVARSNTSHLDFDFKLAKSKTNDNPVYYAMYAHARLCNILVLAEDFIKENGIDYDGELLKNDHEIKLLKNLQDFWAIIDNVSKTFEVHKLTNYINLLSTSIHSFYNECKVIDKTNIPLTKNRLGLVKASKIVLNNALSLIGIKAKEKM